jgi:hypothetical protein
LILLRALKDLSAGAEVTGIVKRTFTALWMLGYNSDLACSSVSISVLGFSDTPEEYWRRSVYYPLLDHIANELETRLVVPKDRFLVQYLIPAKLASLTPERELQVFMPFAGDLPNNNFAVYEAEMVMWKCVNKCARLLSNILPFTFPHYHFCFIDCKIVIGQVACKWHKNLKFSFGCKGGKF